MATGGVDVALAPNSSVILEPADSLSFHLQPQTAPQAVLTIRNVADDRQIAFKVKTTRPLRYLVRPNQGLLGPNGSASIMVILQQKDCDELLRLDPAERQLANDKFLVQSIYVDDSFYELVKTKSTKEMADELTNIQLSSALLQDDKPQKVTEEREGHTGKDAIQEVAALRKKYDELVAFTVQLTAQRDVLMSDLDKTRQLLQKASTDAQRVKKLSEESSTLRHRKNGGTTAAGNEDSQAITGKGPKDQGAFGPMHLLICAIIFFLVGRYY
ncbi:hypothetical protein BBJ29_008052 [Phytophthora kernoviae]|uniref:MSP domain-containing protein n=1 Tax=Phytophthora kernoviae TaxID=325452 RepID=A0A3F2S0D5_9STRA|nr:hypothetical protein BBJ29_008052 [Phytophthora kernoviae]RLN66979.1 hypothetical protein BBP00_00001888 [Phytophthora kernoviae]